MDAYTGEIRIFCGDFPPYEWMFCDGSGLSVRQFTNLYLVIKNIYGGDQNTFYLPDLRGRSPLGAGTMQGGGTYKLGQPGGSHEARLNNIPPHIHSFSGYADVVTTSDPTGAMVANIGARNVDYYGPGTATPDSGLDNRSVSKTGGSDGQTQPFNIRQPNLSVNFIICVNGHGQE